MTQLNSGFERFDGLFQRIDEYADTESIKSGSHSGDATRLTSELGRTGLQFVLFESDTRYSSEGDPLYSPSITAYVGRPRRHVHLKRRELEPQGTGAAEDRRLAVATGQIDEIGQLFSRYRRLHPFYKVTNLFLKSLR